MRGMVWFNKRKMIGGMAFGPPGWMPERIEETFDAAAKTTDPDQSHANATAAAAFQSAAQLHATPAPTLPTPAQSSPSRAFLTDRHSLLEMLATMKLPRTSAIVPGVVEQIESLNGRAVRALALVLLPTQPEFILGAALSRLAMEEMKAGMEALLKALLPQTAMVVMDREDFHTRHLWKPVAAALGGVGARRVPVMNHYPQAHPTLLVRRLLGENLPAGALPSTRDLLLVDPVSCWAIGRYVRSGRGFVDRPVQVFSEGAAARLLMGRIGEPLGEFLRRFKVKEGEHLERTQVIVNGMLTGREVWLGGSQKLAGDKADRPAPPAEPGADVMGMTEAMSLRVPVGNAPHTPCIACGWCVDVCPTGLTPVHLMQLNHRPTPATLRSRDAQEARHCIACGLCSYVCPTRLPLMEQTVALRAKVVRG